MPGTFERFYKKKGMPQDYERAKVLCDEADKLINDLLLDSDTLLYSEMEEKSQRLIMISRLLDKKYFIDRKRNF